MEIELSDSDSDDNDVFILKQIKPVINTSQLLQLTLEGTSVVKNSFDSLKNKSNVKHKYKKRRSNSNENKSKKIKKTISVSKNSTKIAQSPVKSNSSVQSTNSSDDIIVLDKNSVKSVQKCIHSYFVKKKSDISNRVSENTVKVKNDNLLKSAIDQDKNIDLKSHGKEVESLENIEPIEPKVKCDNLLKVANNGDKNINLKSLESVKAECTEIIEPLVNKEKINDSPTLTCKSEDFTKKENKIDKSFETPAVDLNLTPEDVEEIFSQFQNDISDNASTHSKKDIYIDHSELLCSHFKKIIKDEIQKQVVFINESLKNGKAIEKLILEYECQIMENFFKLNENACKVFIRMLGRKKGWHRVCMINYPGISSDLKTEFEILHKEGFVDTNIEDENLKTQMELLNKPEILELCKAFNIKPNNINSSRKESLINEFIKNSENQKSALDMFKIKNSTSRLSILKTKVKTYLGLCVKVNNKVFEAFYKILLLFSFAHYQDEEGKRFSNELFMWLQVIKNTVRFPNYKESPTVVFETLADFEEYKNSLLLQDSFEIAINSKNYDAFNSVYNQANNEFKKLLENTEYCKRFLNLKPFLRKFSAGTVYARILTRYCKTYKRQSSSSEIASTAQLLLDQNIFLIRKRGEWYEILIKALENQKQNAAAAELLIKALNDPVIDDVQKLTLQLRGQSILKKKTGGISDVQVRDLLNILCTSSVQEPSSVEIKGKALEGNEAGFKCVYVEEFENGKVYASVEEKALFYYKSKGFIKGQHSEGFIIHTIYFLLFFDVIYGLSPEGVFQSPYQKAPLDLFSTSFFHNRKEEIELLMNDMLNWDDEETEARIRDSYYKNYNTICVITWNEKFTPELFCEVIKCITMPILVLIFQRLVKNFRTFRSGFPDLTLWNPETNCCKFVEVKSPKDKLSPAQRIWLDFLKNIGLDCEVCNVKNFSGKSFE